MQVLRCITYSIGPIANIVRDRLCPGGYRSYTHIIRRAGVRADVVDRSTQRFEYNAYLDIVAIRVSAEVSLQLFVDGVNACRGHRGKNALAGGVVVVGSCQLPAFVAQCKAARPVVGTESSDRVTPPVGLRIVGQMGEGERIIGGGFEVQRKLVTIAFDPIGSVGRHLGLDAAGRGADSPRNLYAAHGANRIHTAAESRRRYGIRIGERASAQIG